MTALLAWSLQKLPQKSGAVRDSLERMVRFFFFIVLSLVSRKVQEVPKNTDCTKWPKPRRVLDE
jgi:hypothetical protein